MTGRGEKPRTAAAGRTPARRRDAAQAALGRNPERGGTTPPKLPETPARGAPRGIFARWRLRAYGLAAIALFAALLGYGFAGGHWILDPQGRPILTDFSPMWLAGREALRGAAASAYDAARFAALQAGWARMQPGTYPWPYPPPYLLPAAFLAALPYAWAFVLWQAASLCACLLVVRRIVGDGTAAILAAASPLTAYNIMLGQNGLLTAALLGGGLLLVERRPLLAGGLLGCLLYKPQFLILLPLVLTACGRWRPLAGAAVAIALLAGASWLALGGGVWLAFPAALMHRADTALIGHDLSWGLFQSVYGLARFAGMAALPAALAHAALALAATAATCALWRGAASAALKAAAASAATLLVTPYLFAYDMAAIVIPAAFLARDQIERGCLPGERPAMLALFGGLLALFFTHGRVPIGPLVTIGLLALILRRSRAERISRQAANDG